MTCLKGRVCCAWLKVLAHDQTEELLTTQSYMLAFAQMREPSSSW